MLDYMFRQPYLDAETGTGEAGASTETQSTETTQQYTETTETAQQTTEQPKIKVKYNHQEMELPYEEAVTHIQKGMNYEKAVERAKQEARDEYIASQGYEWNGKPIKTEAEYKEAVKEAELRKKYSELPEDVVNELVESKKFREQFETEKRTKAEQERKNAEYTEFFDYFKQKHSRDFDSTKDILPKEVWEMVDKGKSLKDAYTYHYASQLEAEVAEYKAKMQALEVNKANAESSPGSVTGNGSVKDDFISFETYEANKRDQGWVNKNFTKIMESRAKW